MTGAGKYDRWLQVFERTLGETRRRVKVIGRRELMPVAGVGLAPPRQPRLARSHDDANGLRLLQNLRRCSTPGATEVIDEAVTAAA